MHLEVCEQRRCQQNPQAQGEPGTEPPSAGTDSADTLVLDLQLCNWERIHFSSFKLPSLWNVVMADPAN